MRVTALNLLANRWDRSDRGWAYHMLPVHRRSATMKTCCPGARPPRMNEACHAARAESGTAATRALKPDPLVDLVPCLSQPCQLLFLCSIAPCRVMERPADCL